tara:strand:+ start:186 stop:641 length:456 start_codon:yes stop_codon:yes gene_type:complete
MIKLLKNLFESEDPNLDNKTNYSLQILCGLMIEAANSDGHLDVEEIEKIRSILVQTFGENLDEVNLALEQAVTYRDDSKSLHFYTSKINKEYTHDKKIILLETLWEIILSDGKIHDYETSLIRRLSGLLYISDVDSGNARKRALNKISGKL